MAYLLGSVPPSGQHDGHDCVVGFDHLCVACHGFSALATARQGDRTATVLFDVGPYGDVWLANAERLAVDLSSIDVLFLSHWHWDHSGGITTVVAAIAAAATHGRSPAARRRRPPRPARPARHPHAVRHLRDAAAGAHHRRDRSGRRPRRRPRRRATTSADLFLASGDIPRQTSYETGLAGHHSWRGDQVTLDPEIHDERFLAANVRGRGTTVLTACSHAGVVNVGLEARRLLPDQPIDLLLGGYHLAGTTVEDRIEPTVRDLADLVAPADRRARTLHRLASRRRARERLQPDRLRAERRRHALPAQRRLLVRRRRRSGFAATETCASASANC